MTIKIMLTSGTWSELNLDDVELPIQVTPRIDGTFLQGSFKYWSSRSTNIPPYTPLMIDSNYYVCSSSCTKYMTEDNLYCHSIDILDAAALLSCYIVGTKAFSTTGTNDLDESKARILLLLANQKYNTNITLSDTGNLNGKHDFTFSSGHTLWDALSEIGKYYNYIPYVDSISDYGTFSIRFRDVSSSSEYALDTATITSKQYSQEVDNYCKTLETEASNVVDRTTLVHCEKMTIRGENYALNFDEAKLYAPTPIESVKKFGIKGKFYLSNKYYFNAHETETPTTIDGSYTTWDTSGWYNTFEYFKYRIKFEKSDGTTIYPLEEAYNIFVNQLGVDADVINASWVYYTSDMLYQTEDDGDRDYRINVNCSVDLTDKIIEKSKWDLMTSQDRASLCYYTSGSNVIDNLTADYKNGFWNKILSETVYGFYRTALPTSYRAAYETSSGTTKYAYYITPDFPEGNILGEEFFLDYYAITNPVLFDNKSITSINETSFKSSARTYGISANTIDFDRLLSSLKTSNEMLGDVELTLELDNPNEAYIGNHFTLDGATWYITAMTKTIYFEHTNYVLYCNRSYSKVAEAIGVATQYNATKNPLDNIVERPIYMNMTTSDAIDIKKSYYMLLRFYNSLGQISSAIMPVSIMEANNQYYMYCSAMNQYSLGKYSMNAFESNSDSYNIEMFDRAYVDSNNEFVELKATIITDLEFIGESPITQEFMLPLFDESLTSFTKVTNEVTIEVYKDAREKLTFTAKV